MIGLLRQLRDRLLGDCEERVTRTKSEYNQADCCGLKAMYVVRP